MKNRKIADFEVSTVGLGCMGFSHAYGLLSGKYNSQATFGEADFRVNMPQYKAESFAENEVLFNLISQMAEEKHCTMSQLSLAWMLCKKPWIIQSQAAVRRSASVRTSVLQMLFSQRKRLQV